MKKAELVRAHAERFLNDFLETIARAAGLGFIVIASTVIGIQAGHFMVKNACAGPRNLVEAPTYTGSAKTKVEGVDDEYPKPEFKYQYEPVNDEKPVLKKKAQKEEIAHGAQYDAGDELVVEPMSPDFDTSDAPINEQPAAGEAKAEGPATSPTSGAVAPVSSEGKREIDIGRRTAEVR